jgi:hypothetical protein
LVAIAHQRGALVEYTGGGERHALLARCESHGRSITWLDEPAAASGA